MSPEQIIEVDAKRRGVDPRFLKTGINAAIKEGAHPIRSGNTLFIFASDGKGSVDFRWFTADEGKQFAEEVEEFMRMLKKAKSKKASSKYSYAPANAWFRLVDPRFNAKVTKQNGSFLVEMRL